jgi:Carboxypeptidase regulatory-like domain
MRASSRSKVLTVVSALTFLCASELLAQHCTSENLSVPPGFHYPELGFSIRETGKVVGQSVDGEVTDTAGGAVHKAIVEITSVDRDSRVAACFTDRSGHFRFDILPLGRSVLKVTKPGFAPSITPLTVRRRGGHSRVRIGIHPAV